MKGDIVCFDLVFKVRIILGAFFFFSPLPFYCRFVLFKPAAVNSFVVSWSFQKSWADLFPFTFFPLLTFDLTPFLMVTLDLTPLWGPISLFLFQKFTRPYRWRGHWWNLSCSPLLSLPNDVLVSVLEILHFQVADDALNQEEQVNAHVQNHKSCEWVPHTGLSILICHPVIVKCQHMIQQNYCCDLVYHFKSKHKRGLKWHRMRHVTDGHKAANKLRHNLEVKFFVEHHTQCKHETPKNKDHRLS